MIKKDWSRTIRVIYVRWRARGSEDMWFWLARIIRGRSQHERIRRGLERESVPKYELRHIHPEAQDVLAQKRLTAAIRRLFTVAVCQIHLWFENQVAGMSIRVGTKIFNIGGDSGFGVGQCHGSGLLLLEALGLH